MINKYNATFTLAIIILGLAVWNAFDDQKETHDHELFFNDVRAFMNRGDRNTAQMGFRTCLTQNAHSEHLGVPLRDCCLEYFGGDKEKCDDAEHDTHVHTEDHSKWHDKHDHEGRQ